MGEQEKVQRGSKAACRFGQVCFSAEQLELFSLGTGGYVRLQHCEQYAEHGGAMNLHACIMEGIREYRSVIALFLDLAYKHDPFYFVLDKA